jgi:hypothetical protein
MVLGVCSAEDDDADKDGGPLTADAVQKLIDEKLAGVGNMVNSAVKAQLGRNSFRSELAKSIADQLKGDKEGEPDDEPDEPDDEPKKRDRGEDSKKWKKFEAEQAALRRKLEESEKQRQDTELAQARAKQRAELEKELERAGVDAARRPGALALLYTEQQRVREEDGKIGFVVQKEWGEELVPIKDGVNEWLKTDEGKAYLPATPVAGSGNTGGRAPIGKDGKPSRAELINALGNFITRGG